MPHNNIASLFEKHKSHRWDQVRIRFSWENAERQIASTDLYARALYQDWMQDCEHCPENDTELLSLSVGTHLVSAHDLTGFRFEQLMNLISQTWPKGKRNPYYKNCAGKPHSIRGGRSQQPKKADG